MARNNIIKIKHSGEWKLFPGIQKLDITHEPIWSKNTGRTSNGKMKGTIIRYAYKLNFTFIPLNDAEAKTLLNYLESNAFFDVRFKSPVTNTIIEKRFYAGTPTVPVYSYHDNLPRYVGITVNLIEQ